MKMFGIGAWNDCRPCSSADPVSDTVKVEPNFSMTEDKENCVPMQQRTCSRAGKHLERERQERELATEETARLERERQEAEAAEAERQRRALAAAERQAKLEQDLREQEEFAEEQRQRRLRRTEAEAEAFRQAEEERRLVAQAAEESRQKEELAARQREADEQKQLQAFLKEHGFTAVNGKRTRMMKSKYPLHSAAKHNDADMVRVLLNSGANPALKSSAGLTAQQLALKINKAGSHDHVLSALTSQ